MAKKYKLHCFGCGARFYNKGEVYRIDGKPYCGECMANDTASEYERFQEEEWYRNNPGKDMEEEMIKQANIARYGEY